MSLEVFHLVAGGGGGSRLLRRKRCHTSGQETAKGPTLVMEARSPLRLANLDEQCRLPRFPQPTDGCRAFLSFSEPRLSDYKRMEQLSAMR